MEGGVQVLSIYRNDGGSLAQSYIYFVAMRDIEVLDGEGTIKVFGTSESWENYRVFRY